MAYVTKFDGKTDKTISLGGTDKSSGKPNPTSIEGYYLGSKETPDTGYGPGKLHIFQTKTGTTGVWGKTNSNRLLSANHRGQMVLLTFTGMGERKKGRNPAYEFSLKYDAENTIDVSGIDLNASEPEQDDQESPSGAWSSGAAEEAVMEDDDSAIDEVAPVRATAPKVAAAAPSPERAARVQALLAKSRTKQA